MGNFGPLAAKIGSGVWGTPANFNGFLVLAALLHGTLVVGVSQTLRRGTEGATYIQQGGHHVGHWPVHILVFLFNFVPSFRISLLVLCFSFQCVFVFLVRYYISREA